MENNKLFENSMPQAYCANVAKDFHATIDVEHLKELLGFHPYTVENYKATYYSICLNEKGTFDEPKLNISNFEGCPHYYGKIYWKTSVFEIKQLITEKFLEEGKKTGGDWEGYKVGDETQRFLSKESLLNAFELLKTQMMTEKENINKNEKI